jgi:hypothetical protein
MRVDNARAMKRTRTRRIWRAIVAAALCLGVALGSTVACSSRSASRRPAVVTAPLAVDASDIEPTAPEPAR